MKRSVIDVDVKAKLVSVASVRMRQQFEFSEVASVKGGHFFQFEDQQIMLSAGDDVLFVALHGLKHIQLLRNIEKFDSVNGGSQFGFSKMTLLYSGNDSRTLSLTRSDISGLGRRSPWL